MVDLLTHGYTFVCGKPRLGLLGQDAEPGRHPDGHQSIIYIVDTQLVDDNFFPAFRADQRKTILSVTDMDILCPIITVGCRTI